MVSIDSYFMQTPSEKVPISGLLSVLTKAAQFHWQFLHLQLAINCGADDIKNGTQHLLDTFEVRIIYFYADIADRQYGGPC